MSQQFIVLRCYKCETFQVGAVKKSNKWDCKLCGSKQSVKVVFAKGTGKECRLHVQKLNMLRAEKDYLDHSDTIFDSRDENCSNTFNCSDSDVSDYQNSRCVTNFSVKHNESKDSSLKVNSRWCKYVDDKALKEDVENNIDIKDGVQYVLELPDRKNKGRGKRKESNNVSNFNLKPGLDNYANTTKECDKLFNSEMHDDFDLDKGLSYVDNQNMTRNNFGIVSENNYCENKVDNVVEDEENEMCFESDFENYDVAKNSKLFDRKQCFKENKVATTSRWANYVDEEDLDVAADNSDLIDSVVKKSNLSSQNNENIFEFRSGNIRKFNEVIENNRLNSIFDSGNIGERKMATKNNESVLLFDCGYVEEKVKRKENDFACRENNKCKDFLFSNDKESRDDDNPSSCKRPKVFDSYFNEENTDLDNIFDI